jgi:photosystem II stability/assembly factor-like uncharacterized protein
VLCVLVALLFAVPATAEPGVWAGGGPYAGVISSIAVDPGEPGVVYGTGFTAVHRSSDGAASWERLPSFGEQPGFITSITVDPGAPGTVYALTGSGVWRLSQGARDWRLLARRDIGQLAIVAGNPTQPSTLLAATYDSGVVRSVNAGETFTDSSDGLAEPNAVYWIGSAPSEAAVVYLVASDGLYRSVDRGLTWTGATLPEGFFGSAVIDPSDADTLYIFDFANVYRSQDAAATWQKVGGGLQVGGFGFIAALAAAPTTPTTLYAVTDRALFRSTDAGQSFSLRNDDPFAALSPWAIAIDPLVSTRLYRPSGEGVLVSEDGGATFRSANEGLPGLPTQVVALRPGGVFAGTVFGGVRFSGDDGSSWVTGVGGDIEFESILSLAAEPSASGYVYAGTYRGRLFRSQDGVAWAAADERLPRVPIWGIAPDTTLAGRVLAATEVGVFSSRDAGGRWSRSSRGIPNTGVRAVTFSASASAIVYAGVEKGGVYRSTNGGRRWVRAGLGRLTVLSVAVHPLEPDVLFAATKRAGVFRSEDAGRTWTKIAESGLTAAVTLDPAAPDTVIVATDALVLRSLDGGSSFEEYDTGLPDLAGRPGDPEGDYPRVTVGLAAAPGVVWAATWMGVYGVDLS